MRSDWTAADLRRRRAREGRTAPRRTRPRSPKPCSTGCCSPAPSRATSCSTRSSAPARPARWRGGSGATGSASSASNAMSTSPASGSPVDPGARRERDEGRWRRERPSPHAVRHPGRERACVAPGTMLTDAKRRWTATRPRRRHRSSRRPPARSTRSAPTVQGAPACNGWTFWHSSGKARSRRSTCCARPTARWIDPQSAVDLAPKWMQAACGDRPFAPNACTPLTTGGMREPLWAWEGPNRCHAPHWFGPSKIQLPALNRGGRHRRPAGRQHRLPWTSRFPGNDGSVRPLPCATAPSPVPAGGFSPRPATSAPSPSRALRPRRQGRAARWRAAMVRRGRA